MFSLTGMRSELQKSADEKTKNSFLRFFKEPVLFYGVKSALVGKIAQSTYEEIKHLEKQELFTYCEDLLKSGICEEAWIAADWAYRMRNQFEKKDFFIFEYWIEKYIDNWAECDTFCNHSVGFLVEKYPVLLTELKRWAHSKNRWMKRASAVTLIIPARNGLFLKDAFEIADILLMDTDDMVQKGYGWLLKVAAAKHETDVFDYVMKHKVNMPRTALRYAIEKMPESLRNRAMH